MGILTPVFKSIDQNDGRSGQYTLRTAALENGLTRGQVHLRRMALQSRLNSSRLAHREPDLHKAHGIGSAIIRNDADIALIYECGSEMPVMHQQFRVPNQSAPNLGTSHLTSDIFFGSCFSFSPAAFVTVAPNCPLLPDDDPVPRLSHEICLHYSRIQGGQFHVMVLSPLGRACGRLQSSLLGSPSTFFQHPLPQLQDLLAIHTPKTCITELAVTSLD